MKKILIILLILSSSLSCAIAQSPAPSPTAAPAATAPSSASALPHQALVALVAGQIVAQMSNTANTLLQAVEGGIPAQQNGQPAIEAKELQAALGPEYVAWLRSVAAGAAAASSPKK